MEDKRAFPVGKCYGCGGPIVSRTALWHTGCDKKAIAALIDQEYGTVADFMVAYGYNAYNPILKEGTQK